MSGLTAKWRFSETIQPNLLIRALLIVTGSAYLIGPQALRYLTGLGRRVHGLDNNMRVELFGPDDALSWSLQDDVPGHRDQMLDIRVRASIVRPIENISAGISNPMATQLSHAQVGYCLQPADSGK